MLDDSRLAQLLRETDAVQSVHVDPLLVPHVRRLARRRARARRIVVLTSSTAMAALVLIVTMVFFGSTKARTPLVVKHDPSALPHSNEASIASLREAYAQLTTEADLHERTAKCLTRMEGSPRAASRPGTARAQLPFDDPLYAVRAQRDRGAQVLLRFGDSIARRSSGNTMAIEAYRQAVSLSPDSGAGADARRRLEQIGVY